MKRTRIKMCGTTRLEDARAAVDFGVDALGFIFVAKSPRYVTKDQAYDLIKPLPSFISKVGVFVDSNIDEIKDVVEYCGLTQVQLHGNETTRYCLDLRRWNRSISVCKALRVGEGSHDVDICSYEDVTDSILLDTYSKGIAGGTGATFDWSLVDSLKLHTPLILAGGLGPENICEAVKKVSPFAVDINSGVEQSPGIKDHQKLQTVIELVQKADVSFGDI